MKITILGSSAFREEKVRLYDELNKMGHEPIIHPHYIESVKEGKTEIMDRITKGEHAQLKIENDYIMWYYNAIVSGDAVLVVNIEKNGQKNYIGGNVFLEIGFAYVNKKKIFMYNDYPLKGECKYLDEIEAMQPIVINQDLSKII
ncbi:MAG: hypothetical protein UR66_C0005G0072 [Candidatus Moranbacteria bacterium GW2011_GWE1_35_17]|nr:MAG: hypothetical protein UR66_C0005G0072 [Candidatus Moranbacteria bacterium GW2011_GWE1_35_17]KKP81810.1 MAG: hypothetical protein UR82_C0051G0016 [Candidatus Moranbacteria bacterium GW2011_GWF1_35_5]